MTNQKSNVIVIVDDEPQILRSLKWELEIAPFNQPFQIETFEGSEEALEFISDNFNDVFLLISDLRMPSPSLNGSDLLLHVHREYPDINLIMLTAFSDIDEIQKAISAEIQALILKPWTSGMLVSEIIKAYQITRSRIEHNNLQKKFTQQLSDAGEFQRKLLTPISLTSVNLNIDLRYEPLNTYKCGGDYYDFIQIEDTKDLILAGDVSGHGIRAAFVTAIIKSFSLSILNDAEPVSASGFLNKMNNRLCEILSTIDNILVTFSVLILDYEKNLASYSNAGHLPVYKIRNGKSKKIWHPGQAMGFTYDINYSNHYFDIQKGDRFILVSDGLVESVLHGGILSDDLIFKELETASHSAAPTDCLYENFKKYHEDKTYSDDVLIASIELNPET